MEEGKQPSQIPGTPCEVCERGTSPHMDMTLWRSFRVRKDGMREKAFCTNAVWERGVSTLEKINSIPAKKKNNQTKKHYIIKSTTDCHRYQNRNCDEETKGTLNSLMAWALQMQSALLGISNIQVGKGLRICRWQTRGRDKQCLCDA